MPDEDITKSVENKFSFYFDMYFLVSTQSCCDERIPNSSCNDSSDESNDCFLMTHHVSNVAVIQLCQAPDSNHTIKASLGSEDPSRQ